MSLYKNRLPEKYIRQRGKVWVLIDDKRFLIRESAEKERKQITDKKVKITNQNGIFYLYQEK